MKESDADNQPALKAIVSIAIRANVIPRGRLVFASVFVGLGYSGFLDTLVRKINNGDALA